MTTLTLEPQQTKTDVAENESAQWISTAAEPCAAQPRFVRLSTKFDLAVASQLRRMAALQAGWDAEAARPISSQVLSAARDLVSHLPGEVKYSIPIPVIVPMARGADRPSVLQFEWDDGRRCLELEIEDPSTIHYLKWAPDEGVEEEDAFGIHDSKRAVALIRWFTG